MEMARRLAPWRNDVPAAVRIPPRASDQLALREPCEERVARDQLDVAAALGYSRSIGAVTSPTTTARACFFHFWANPNQDDGP